MELIQIDQTTLMDYVALAYDIHESGCRDLREGWSGKYHGSKSELFDHVYYSIEAYCRTNDVRMPYLPELQFSDLVQIPCERYDGGAPWYPLFD